LIKRGGSGVRRIYIVFGIIFTLLANFTVTGMLQDAGAAIANTVAGTKENQAATVENKLSLDQVVNVVIKGVENGEVLFTLGKSDFSKELEAVLDLYNQARVYIGEQKELFYPQVVEFELNEGEPVVVKGEIFTGKDYFLVEQGKARQAVESNELKKYLKTFIMALVPELAFKDVALVNAGQQESVIFGSPEMDNLSPKLNEVVKPVVIAPRTAKASITKEQLLKEIQTNTGLKYVDALLYRPVTVKGANAARVLVLANGTFQNFVIYTDAAYNILDAQKVDSIAGLEF